MTERRWAPVRGYEGIYEVSDDGLVRNASGKVLRSRVNRGGYHQVGLHRDGRSRTLEVHRLVLTAFEGRRDDLFACHNNGMKTDNRLANLRWATNRENQLDTITHGRNAFANQTHCKNGHEFTEENTRLDGTWRRCRQCNRDYIRRHWERKLLS